MVAPIIGAIARAALSQGAKSAAKKAIAKKSAGKAVTQKAASQAAKRYSNAADRWKKESKEVGEKKRYGQMLKKAATRAEHFAKEIRSTDFSKQDVPARVLDLISKSDDYLVKSTRSPKARGDLLGEVLTSGTMQGHRLYAVTRDLWEGGAENYYERLNMIREAFGGNMSLADIIQKIQKDTGVNIMKGDINSKERYGELTLAEIEKVQLHIMQHYG